MRGTQAIRRQVASRARKSDLLPLSHQQHEGGSSLSMHGGGVTWARIHSSVASQPPDFTPGAQTSSQLLGCLLLNPGTPSAAAVTGAPPQQAAAAAAAVPHGQYNGTWAEEETLLARIFGGFPHLPCSHSQDLSVVRDLIHTFSDFVLHLDLEQQVWTPKL